MQQRTWKKLWPLEDTVMGLQEEMFFSKLLQTCHTCLCSRPQHTSLQGQIHAVDCGFQFSMCVGQRNAFWPEPNFSAPMTMLPNRLIVFARQSRLVMASPYIDLYTENKEDSSSASKVLTLWRRGR